jgi:hypothetical protein
MDEATDKITTSDWNERDTTATESIASASVDDDYEEDAEQIRAEIEDTRAEMSQTINEIQERLSPEHLMGQVKETVREATIGKVERVMETIGEVTEPAREAIYSAGTTIKESASDCTNRTRSGNALDEEPSWKRIQLRLRQIANRYRYATHEASKPQRWRSIGSNAIHEHG